MMHIPSQHIHAMDEMRRLTAEMRQSGSARVGMEELRDMIERQHLLLQSLLVLLLEKKVFSEEEFRQWMDYVDQLDGSRDGRIKEDRSPTNCPHCGRINQRLARNCQYCGTAIESEFLARRPQP